MGVLLTTSMVMSLDTPLGGLQTTPAHSNIETLPAVKKSRKDLDGFFEEAPREWDFRAKDTHED
jgi:hypothetical protein